MSNYLRACDSLLQNRGNPNKHLWMAVLQRAVQDVKDYKAQKDKPIVIRVPKPLTAKQLAKRKPDYKPKTRKQVRAEAVRRKMQLQNRYYVLVDWFNSKANSVGSFLWICYVLDLEEGIILKAIKI